MSKVIVLVRHASAKESSPTQLSASGLEMAEAIAKELTKIAPDNIFSSPTLRARRTADIIAASLRLRVINDARLDEREAERLGKNDFRVNWLESFDSVISRITSFMADAPTGISVAVTHKESIRAAIAPLMGLDDITGRGLRVDNCSLTTIALVNDTTRILSIGSPNLTTGLVKRIGESE